jgi:hypothetical protein
MRPGVPTLILSKKRTITGTTPNMSNSVMMFQSEKKRKETHALEESS